jgi:type I restriction enzyme S subunit
MDTEQHTNAAGIENSSARLLPMHTVCLSRTASVGYVVVMGRPMATSQDFVNWVCGEQLDWRFLKYILLAERESYTRFAHGTTHQTIYFPEVKAFHVCLPPRSEQDRIAGVLGALDDKIEHNLRVSADLERAAAAHFRHLFPVIEGGAPLGNYVEVVKGKSYKSDELADSTSALVTLKSIRRGGGYSPGGLKPFTGDYKSEQVVGPGDIVVAQTDLTQAADVIGKPAIVPARTPYDVLVASLDLAILRPLGDRISRLFVYYLLRSEAFQRHAYAYSNGSTVLHLANDAIPEFAFEVPEPPALASFDRLAEPLFAAAEALAGESETLAVIRDTLLPKLVSGAIRLPASYDANDALATVAESAGAAVP